MRRVLVRISFLGDKFYGTQKLKGLLTIQQLYEDALYNLTLKEIKVTISSRLDRYVSALDFALSFDFPMENYPLDRLSFYLSNYCKYTHIKDVKEVDEDFSSRYSCSKKVYSYLIQNGRYNPIFENNSLYLKNKIDEDLAYKALSCFVGKHDFKGFASFDEEENSILDIEDVSINDECGLTVLSVCGKRFLKYQVRFMIGAVLGVSYNKLSIDDIKSILDNKKENHYRKKADAKGLLLKKIVYPSIDEEDDYLNSSLFLSK